MFSLQPCTHMTRHCSGIFKRGEMPDMQLVNEKFTPLTETGEPAKPPPVPGKRAKRYRRGL